MAESSEEENAEDPNYYSVLNVRKDATEDEIKTAYRQMCVMYHPDKHQIQEQKQVAVEVFNKVQRAYQVLSDPDKRGIYDIYGQKGLDAGWELIERHRTPEEIRQEYERLRQEQEERRLQQRTNPKGSVQVKINATDLFDSYEDQYYEEEGGSIPNIEVSGMTISQSIEAPLTTRHTAVLSGNLHVQNGNGSGNVKGCIRRIMSHQSWGEVEVGAGDGPTVVVKGFRNLTKTTFGTVSLDAHLKEPTILAAGLQLMVAKQLTKQTMGYLSWRGGFNSYMSSTIVRNTEKYNFVAMLQLGVPNTLGTLQYQHKFNTDTNAKVSLKYGLAFGPVFEYSCDHQISKHSRVSGSVIIGTATGVTVKLKLVRHTQSYSFPILLSENIVPSAVFYGTVVPLLAYWIVKTAVITPFLRSEKQRDIESQQTKSKRQMEEKKRQAEANILLVRDSYSRSVETERRVRGLIIKSAWYGKLISTDLREDSTTRKVIDVTIPLQCLVKDSKLILTESSKASLNGFYDPCVGEDKSLKIVYEFHENLHEVVIQDSEICRIPKQSHRIHSTTGS